MSLRTLTVFRETEVQVYEVSFRRCRYGRILQSITRCEVSASLILYCFFSLLTIPSQFLLGIYFSFFSLLSPHPFIPFILCVFILFIATRLLTGRSGVQIRYGQELFFFSKTSRPALSPRNFLFSGYRGFFPEGKCSGK